MKLLASIFMTTLMALFALSATGCADKTASVLDVKVKNFRNTSPWLGSGPQERGIDVLKRRYYDIVDQ